MQFGIFYEHQLPKPWSDDDEFCLLRDALDQVELADRLGFDYAWEVEHHFLDEYSHSSAPEVFLPPRQLGRRGSGSATASGR
jgi:alkanesulfonate monooxygenase SsuD/methylene tetrahydromethanopterin reductase-like flavin-dependent oxidoreductase (luciferase family)